ncbi:MAG TPA: 3-oxoadipate enol-lactonase [Solirubrobacteraceae bacterium]|nr:3-oxoadipate enol-lactonase [Solirubrobacteraceae bacterium]
MTALHHEVSGPEGAPALLMGGSLGTTLRMWDAQLPLAERLRLVRFDHRGHGGSPSPPAPYDLGDLGRDVLELMDRLELERASYCGLSIGGMVGMWLAAHAPDRVERLVLICTSAHMPPASAWHERAWSVLSAGSTEPIADAVVGRWLTPAFAAEHPEVRDGLRAMLAAADAPGYAACCGALARMDLRADLPKISAPTLVISGADDESTPVPMQEQIVAAIPGARHEIVRPAAHVAAIERPDIINQLIEEHLL